MSGVDPSKLYMKNEITPIRKGSRVFQDPRTTSCNPSRYPILSSRSVIPSYPSLDTDRPRVFLHNWRKTHNLSRENSLNDVCNGDWKSDSSNTNMKMLTRKKHQNVLCSGRKSTRPKSTMSNVPGSQYSGGDDSDSLIEQSDDTGQCSKPEGLMQFTRISSKMLKTSPKDDPSYTCNSTLALSCRSHNSQCGNNPNSSLAGSWDSNNWVEEENDNMEFSCGPHCGIPCYWSKKTHSDTSSTKGSQNMYGMHNSRASSVSTNCKADSRASRGLLPLLTNGSHVGSDDELSPNFRKLDSQSMSQFDWKRWSSKGEEGTTSALRNMRSFNQKYRPMFFEELIGQSIVVQSLINAISKGRISPVYLLQGPSGTGKTSTARIFAASLNCTTDQEDAKPCGKCRECADFISGKSRDIREIDGKKKDAVDRVNHLLKNMLLGGCSVFSRYNVFIIDDCHMLPYKMWHEFLKFLEEPPPRVVFVLITTNLDNMPRTVISRCQKYLFSKIKDCDIVSRLRKISDEENLEVDLDALNLIAFNSDGSLRHAEAMLDQLSLIGQGITVDLVNELVGVVSDDKLMELLEIAMSSDTAKTVKSARELLKSGIDPKILMSQMANLIMDIISDPNYSHAFFRGQSLTDTELERLKHALKLLSGAEKKMSVLNECSVLFTATLLQLGSVYSSDFTQSGSSRRQSSKTTEDEALSNTSKEIDSQKNTPDRKRMLQKSTSSQSIPHNGHYTHQGNLLSSNSRNFKPTTHNRLMDSDTLAVSHGDFISGDKTSSYKSSGMLDDIWKQCLDSCHSKTLRQLLHSHGKLLSISEVEGIIIAYIAFKAGDIKSGIEWFLSSVTDSIETVLKCKVRVRIILSQDGEDEFNSIQLPDSFDQNPRKYVSAHRVGNSVCSNSGYSGIFSHQNANNLSSKTFNGYINNLKARGTRDHFSGSPSLVGIETTGMIERVHEIPLQRIESIIREQNLETAWLQTAEKTTSGSLNQPNPKKNKVMPQDGTSHHNRIEYTSSVGFCSEHSENELSHEIKTLNIGGVRTSQNDQNSGRVERHTLDPSLLHDAILNSNSIKHHPDYGSGGKCGWSVLFCCNKIKHSKNRKVSEATSVLPRKGIWSSWFGKCGLSQTR